MAILSSTIMNDTECHKCGYNLRGLIEGARCPECGTSARKIYTQSKGTMSDEAPTHFVSKLRTGFALASIGILGTLVFSGAGLIFLTSLFWVAGIWIATSPRPGQGAILPDKILDNERYRQAVRMMNLAWPVYGLALLAASAIMSKPAGPSMLIKAPVFFMLLVSGAVAWTGLVPTCVYFAELGHWASHDKLAQRLRATAWTMAVFGVITVLLKAIHAIHIGPSDAANFLSIFTVMVLVIAVAVFLFTILQLTTVMHWVMKHQQMTEGSADRVRRRIERDMQGHGSFVSDLICEYCKYDLEGLPIGGRCPECGESYDEHTGSYSAPVLSVPVMMSRDESDIEIEDGDSRGIYFNSELDANGKPKQDAHAFNPDEDVSETEDIKVDDADSIPLAGESFDGDGDSFDDLDESDNPTS
ncbi:hypothetical protein COB72_04515 [bacterium]|nr:MAG: hypothetical protein COB72_04515 [bacterium]